MQFSKLKVLYSALFACQLGVQAYLVHAYSTSSAMSIGVLAAVLAAIQTLMAFGVILSVQVSSSGKMPESGMAKRIGMFYVSGLFTLVISTFVLGFASLDTHGLATTQFWALLISSPLAGSALNSLFVSALATEQGA